MEKVADILDSLPYLLKMPSKKIWIDYDEEADVPYISFRKPQQENELRKLISIWITIGVPTMLLFLAFKPSV